MKEIEYVIYLSAESTDRLRVYVRKEKGEILEFVIQYEALFSEKWQAIVRYDTAHGFGYFKPDGEIIKHPLFFETYNLAFTFATLDLKANWKQYEPVAQIPICHPELVSGSRNSLILLDAETSSA